jgi:hypothetical protein
MHSSYTAMAVVLMLQLVFGLIPYFPRTMIPIPMGILDADSQQIRKLEDSDFADDPNAIADESQSHIEEDE